MQGETGTGKTLFGIEFIYRGIVDFDEPGMIDSFLKLALQKLMRDSQAMGWDLAELQARNEAAGVFTASPEVLEQEVRARPTACCWKQRLKSGPSAFLSDGKIEALSTPFCIRAAPGAGGTCKAHRLSRITCQQIIEALSREKLTSLISHETGITVERQTTLEAAGFLADTVIDLSRKVHFRARSPRPSRL